MDLTIECPHCRVKLSVPDRASGRAARCPACHAKFRVPQFESMLDETVAAWLFTEEQDEVEQNVDPPRRSEDPTARAAATRDAPAAAPRTTLNRMSNRTSKQALNQTPRQTVTPATQSASTLEVPDPAASPPARQDTDTRQDQPTMPPKRDRPPKTLTPHAAASTDDPPRLNVGIANTSAVTLTFSSQLLNRSAFRASMPFCCLACADDEDHHLTARPLGWFDQSQGTFGACGEVEARYEVQVKAGQTLQEVVQSMRPIVELSPPFNNPMPYFVCAHCASSANIQCRTIATAEGTNCELNLPSGSLALHWLGRVNGICGDEYTLLEHLITQEASEQWSAVPLMLRQQLVDWCRLEPSEQFVKYIPDSDFTKNDEGLAGVVITDRRVVHCKHHQRGSIDMEQDGHLTLVRDGHFYDLHYHHDHLKRRMVRLRQRDGHELIHTLDELRKPLRVVRGTKS